MSEIELSKSTINTIKKLSQINQTLRLIGDSEILKSCNESGVMFCSAPIEDKFPRDFNIYNLKEFLSVIDIIETPVIDFSSDKFVTIKSKDGKQKLRYLESDPKFVTSYTDKALPTISADFSAVVSEQQFKSVVAAAQTMGLEYVGFFGDGDKISVVAFNKNNGDDNETNNFSIEVGESETDQPFKMYYKLSIHNIEVLIGEGELTFDVSSRKISKIQTESGKTFWVTMDTKSEFGV